MRILVASTVARVTGVAAIAVACCAVPSALHAGKGGNGKAGQNSGGSFISAQVDGVLFFHTLSGETADAAETALVTSIDANPLFEADTNTATPLGFEGDDIVYEVFRAGGGEVDSLEICETDSAFRHSAVHIATGRSTVLILRPSSVAGDGLFRLQWVLSSTPGTVNQIPDIDTSGFPTPASLFTEIITRLQAAGLTAVQDGLRLRITKNADTFLTFRVESSDTSITSTCVYLGPPPPPPPTAQVPSMPEYAMAILGLALLAIAIALIRRRTRTVG